jgi:hypothetical protein
LLAQLVDARENVFESRGQLPEGDGLLRLVPLILPIA